MVVASENESESLREAMLAADVECSVALENEIESLRESMLVTGATRLTGATRFTGAIWGGGFRPGRF